MLHDFARRRMDRQHPAAAGADVDAEDEWGLGHDSIIEESASPVERLGCR